MTEELVKVDLIDLQNVATSATLCRLWKFAKDFLSDYYDSVEDGYAPVSISRGVVTGIRLYKDRDLFNPVKIDLTKPAWVEAINNYMMRRRKDMKIYDADPILNGLNRPMLPYDQYAIDTLVFRQKLAELAFHVPGLSTRTVLEMKNNQYDWVNQFYVHKEVVNNHKNALYATLDAMNAQQQEDEAEANTIRVNVAEARPTTDATRPRAVRIG